MDIYFINFRWIYVLRPIFRRRRSVVSNPPTSCYAVTSAQPDMESFWPYNKQIKQNKCSICIWTYQKMYWNDVTRLNQILRNFFTIVTWRRHKSTLKWVHIQPRVDLDGTFYLNSICIDCNCILLPVLSNLHKSLWFVKSQAMHYVQLPPADSGLRRKLNAQVWKFEWKTTASRLRLFVKNSPWRVGRVQ